MTIYRNDRVFEVSKTSLGYGAIDIVINLCTPEAITQGRLPNDSFQNKVGVEDTSQRGMSLDHYLDKMDRASVEKSFIAAMRCEDRTYRTSTEIPYEMVQEACQRYPQRFAGLAGIDPFRGIAGLKQLDRAVELFGFVGEHLLPRKIPRHNARRVFKLC